MAKAPTSQGINLSRSFYNSSHGPQQRGNLPPGLNRLGRIATVLEAFVLPLGAPGDFPPCRRHRPFGIAGDCTGSLSLSALHIGC
jgi:hypothetical protein